MLRRVSARSQRSSVFAIRIYLHFLKSATVPLSVLRPRSSAIQASDFGHFGLRFFTYLLRT